MAGNARHRDPSQNQNVDLATVESSKTRPCVGPAPGRWRRRRPEPVAACPAAGRPIGRGERSASPSRCRAPNRSAPCRSTRNSHAPGGRRSTGSRRRGRHGGQTASVAEEARQSRRSPQAPRPRPAHRPIPGSPASPRRSARRSGRVLVLFRSVGLEQEWVAWRLGRKILLLAEQVVEFREPGKAGFLKPHYVARARLPFKQCGYAHTVAANPVNRGPDQPLDCLTRFARQHLGWPEIGGATG